MFTIFSFLAVLIALMPHAGLPALHHSNTPNFKVISSWQMKKIPTPTGISSAVNRIVAHNNPVNTLVESNSVSNSNSVSDGNSDTDAQETIPDNRYYPTPTLHPMPVTTDSPTPTPVDVDAQPTLVPFQPGDSGGDGCPPCQGGGKYACIEIQCPK